MKKFLLFFILIGVTSTLVSAETPHMKMGKRYPALYYQQKHDTFFLNFKDQQFIVTNFPVLDVWDIKWHRPTGKLYVFYHFMGKVKETTIQQSQIMGVLGGNSNQDGYKDQFRIKKRKFKITAPSKGLAEEIDKTYELPIPGAFDAGGAVFVPYTSGLAGWLEEDEWDDAVPIMSYDPNFTASYDADYDKKQAVEEPQPVSYSEEEQPRRQNMPEQTQNQAPRPPRPEQMDEPSGQVHYQSPSIRVSPIKRARDNAYHNDAPNNPPAEVCDRKCQAYQDYLAASGRSRSGNNYGYTPY